MGERSAQIGADIAKNAPAAQRRRSAFPAIYAARRRFHRSASRDSRAHCASSILVRPEVRGSPRLPALTAARAALTLRLRIRLRHSNGSDAQQVRCRRHFLFAPHGTSRGDRTALARSAGRGPVRGAPAIARASTGRESNVRKNVQSSHPRWFLTNAVRRCGGLISLVIGRIPLVIARTKRRSNPALRCRTGLLRCARNDEGKAFSRRDLRPSFAEGRYKKAPAQKRGKRSAERRIQ